MADDDAARLGQALIDECARRLFDEGEVRLKSCLDLLTEEQVWNRSNAATNSVGNLVLHLSGNVGQWIVAGLGAEPDNRVRQQEFDERGPIPKAELRSRLEATMTAARAALASLDPASLLEVRKVQCFEETGLSVLVHVVEHFSYHVGQVTHMTKVETATDTGYYAGLDLAARG